MPAPKRPPKGRRNLGGQGSGQGVAAPPVGLNSSNFSDTSVIVQSVIASAQTEPVSTVSSRDLDVSWGELKEFAHRPDNPRWEREYDPEQDPELAALGATLDEYNILQAVTVTSIEAWLEHHPDDQGEFGPDVDKIVIMGNRRLAIARHRGLEGLPFFRNDKLAHPRAAREAPIIENYHRKPTDPIREGAEMVAILEMTGESRRAFAERMGISHTQVNQRIQLLDLIPEFQGMVSDLDLSVQKALKLTVLDHDIQRAILEQGPPYSPPGAEDEQDDDSGKTLSTRSAVTIKRRSTPSDVAGVLRAKLSPEFVDEVLKLLTAPQA
jgi:ParB family chromosome partitioning protein